SRPLAPPARGFPPPPIDREKTCTLLLRFFYQVGEHHSKEDFAVRGKEPKDEVQIYTWKDATLHELTDLVRVVTPAAKRRDARLSFAFIFPDTNDRFVVREVGKTDSHRNGKLDDNKALAQLGFQIGDYLDVAIL
ncbi:hypothetical protein POPTR_014G074000v4, partial [Populus trichocarpa]